MPMEAWSPLPVPERFRIKFFLDTNILVYLIDGSYSSLTQMIDILNESAFAELVSSMYVVFEFVGVRRREHYLRQVVKSTSGGTANISALLKYKDDYSSPSVDYDTVKASLKATITSELSGIVNNLGIVYDNNVLHNGLLAPTHDLILSSKLSGHDALVYVSSVWADSTAREDFVVVLTNDEAFFKECPIADVQAVMTTHNLHHPQVEWLKTIQEVGTTLFNVTNSIDPPKLVTTMTNKLRDLITIKNEKLFLGTTIACGNGATFPQDVVCFALKENTELQSDLFLTIVGKDLDFIYQTQIPIEQFWNRQPILSYPFSSASITNISFRPHEKDPNGNAVALPLDILSRLRERGNLIFINPD